MSFNAFGKPAETVDFGGEVDYASYEWFKDPPPRTEVLSVNFPYILCNVMRRLTRSPPRLHFLKANPIPPSRALSKRMRCVTLPCKRRPTCCSGVTNSTGRCGSC